MRAMPLVAPDDPRSDEFMLQYMLGDWLLTCAFTDTLYLPAGTWIDYWIGTAHEGPRELKCEPPADRGGPLFVKAGAIIPTWPPVDYVGQRLAETVGIELFPHGHSEFTLYEDDGLTEAYRQGHVATTHIACDCSPKTVTVTVGPRIGAYEGMPESRFWELTIHLPARPTAVVVNSAPHQGWECVEGHCATDRLLRLVVPEDPTRSRATVVRCSLN